MPAAPQLITNTVLLSEEKPLSVTEMKTLVNIRNRKIRYLASTYFVLLACIFYGWLMGPFKTGGRYTGGRRPPTEEEIERFNLVAPVVIAFLFIILTAFFVHYYFKTLHTYIKDIKGRIKILYYFEPESYKTPFFDTYYIKTISRKRPMVRITKELYDAIQPGCRACISMSPFARFVFTIEVEDKKMEFNEKNSILDL